MAMASLIGSFDPSLKSRKLKQYQDEHGKENIVMIERSKLFLTLKILHPLFRYCVLYAGLITGVSYLIQDPTTTGYTAIIGLVAIIILFGITHGKRLLDYLMDFIIITPSRIVSYNQTGIRKRNNKTIDCSKIKSITTSYRNWIFSLANNGDMAFLSEGDKQGGGEIQAFYVYKPGKKKDKIQHILEKGKKQKGNITHNPQSE